MENEQMQVGTHVTMVSCPDCGKSWPYQTDAPLDEMEQLAREGTDKLVFVGFAIIPDHECVEEGKDSI